MLSDISICLKKLWGFELQYEALSSPKTLLLALKGKPGNCNSKDSIILFTEQCRFFSLIPASPSSTSFSVPTSSANRQ